MSQQHCLRHCDLSITSFPEFEEASASAWPLFLATKFNAFSFLGHCQCKTFFSFQVKCLGREQAGKGMHSHAFGRSRKRLGSEYPLHPAPLARTHFSIAPWLTFPQQHPFPQVGHTQATCRQTSENNWLRTSNFLLQGGLHIENNTSPYSLGNHQQHQTLPVCWGGKTEL